MEIFTRNISLLIVFVYLIGVLALGYGKIISVAKLMTFLAVIPLAIIAITQEQIKKWWNAPKLKIDFALGSPFCSKTPFYVFLGKQTKIDTQAYYFRVKIVNYGRTSAKLCEVVMTELLVETDEGWKMLDYFQQVNLRWDTGKTKDAYITLNPSPVGMLCDVGHISKDHMPNLFHFDYLYTIGGYQPTVLGENTKYRFSIAVVSENSKFITKSFEFYWTGKWQDKEEDMFKEITITPIENIKA